MRQGPLRPACCLNVGVTGHRLDRVDAASFDRGDPEMERVLRSIASIADSVRASLAAVFDDMPTRLRLLSGLAEGSDRRVARLAHRCGYSLHALLPFDRDIYADDFGPESQIEYRALLDQSATVFEMPGERAKAERAYEMVGTGLIAQCDLLIAVWDGSAARGPGGTAEVMRRALKRGLPVLRFDPARWDAPMLLWACLGTVAIEHENLGDYPAAPASDEVLRRVLEQLILPPTAPEERAHLSDFLREHERTSVWRLEYPVMLWALRVKRLSAGTPRVRPYNDATIAEWHTFMDCAGRFAPRMSQAESRLRDAYAWPDKLATHFAQVFRSGHVANFCLAAIAVMLAAAGFIARDLKIIFVPLEIVAIVSLLVHTHVGRARQWHRRWLDYRYVAERLRPMRTLKLFGLASSGTPAPTERFDSMRWTDWYAQAAWREMGPPAGRVDGRYEAMLRSCLLGEELCPQIRYHWASAGDMEKLEQRLHRLGDAFFGATLLACAAYLMMYALAYEQAEHLSRYFSALTAAFPAVGGATYGIRVQGDFNGTAMRSLRTADELLLVASTIDQAATLSQASDLAERAARAMLAELAEWQVAFSQRNLEIPA